METDARFEFSGEVLNRLRAELASARKAKNLRLYQIVQALIWIGEEGAFVLHLGLRRGRRTVYHSDQGACLAPEFFRHVRLP